MIRPILKFQQLLCPVTFFKPLCLMGTYSRYSTPYTHPNPLNQPKPTKRKWKSKHKDNKFKAERAGKVFKMELPDFQDKKTEFDMTPDEMNKRMKELGMHPIRNWTERPIFVPCTGETFEPYIPPEGDGKAKFLSKEGAKQSVEFLSKKGKSMMALRKIKVYEENLKLDTFCETAKKIYIDLHNTLCDLDEKKLHSLATEAIYPLLMTGIKLKTIRWNYHGSLEPEKVVHVRKTQGISEDDIFAQITVRFHTQQTLAVYDRFGRLMYGSECVLRDVLEYIVFEKHISNIYGIWRVHEKLIPTWMELPNYSLLTYKEDVVAN